jgi:hypothetical protein
MAATPLAVDPLDRLLDSVTECLTPEVAKRLVELRVDPQTQARIDELADKANGGQLSPGERDEYAGFVEAIDLVAILQAKARRLLVNQVS